MRKKRIYEAVATLVGCVIGAGILGIPYVVARAGLLTGIIDIVGLGLLFLVLHLYLGEVCLRTKGAHQIPGYAEKYLGKTGKKIVFVSVVLGAYGSLIAYLIGGGAAIASLFGISALIGSVIFFVIFSAIVYLGLKAIEDSEGIGLPFVLGIITLVFILALFKMNSENLTGFYLGGLLIPYGVVMFAYGGHVAIPEMVEELKEYKKDLKRAILIGSMIPIVAYVMFAIAFVSVLGMQTPEVGALGMAAILGSKLEFLGAIFALFNMGTSFLAIGLALQELFHYDYHISKLTSWFLACCVPFLIFLLIRNLVGFTSVLNITGVIVGASNCVIVMLLAYHAKKKGERTPEYTIPINIPIIVILSTLFIIGALNLLFPMMFA